MERRLLAQTLTRLDDMSARLDSVVSRLEEVQALVEITAARVASRSERDMAVVESEAQSARRVGEIERMLGASPPGTR